MSAGHQLVLLLIADLPTYRLKSVSWIVGWLANGTCRLVVGCEILPAQNSNDHSDGHCHSNGWGMVNDDGWCPSYILREVYAYTYIMQGDVRYGRSMVLPALLLLLGAHAARRRFNGW